ncbi:hypothetical protein NQZ68_013650 [Dissostichus eleginoides]|nr:hypothetical protein NQZ68_013650 [Dissostichus eleginoides]
MFPSIGILNNQEKNEESTTTSLTSLSFNMNPSDVRVAEFVEDLLLCHRGRKQCRGEQDSLTR